MEKLNSPKIDIRYVIGVDIQCVNNQNTLNNSLSRPTELTKDIFSMENKEIKKYGKKGFYLSGGNVDEETHEVSGCLMDGSYTFFDNVEKYTGIVGTVLSNNNYTFNTEQFVTVRTKNTGDVITAIALTFDNVAGEFATDIKFSTEPNKIYKNNKMIFIKSFGQNSNVTQVKISFVKWSKKNSLAKLLKISTTITGEYDYKTIKSMDFSDEKVSNEEEVSFGVTNQYCDISLIDKNGDIQALHEANMLDGDVVAKIYLVNSNNNGTADETHIGSFILSTYENEKGTNVWKYSLVDKLEKIKDVVVEPHEVEQMTIKQVVEFVLSKVGLGGFIDWETTALTHCSSIVIPNAWIEANQYAYDVLCKCCEVGLLRVFINALGNVRIERGL